MLAATKGLLNQSSLLGTRSGMCSQLGYGVNYVSNICLLGGRDQWVQDWTCVVIGMLGSVAVEASEMGPVPDQG
jgi:hypothetical protein